MQWCCPQTIGLNRCIGTGTVELLGYLKLMIQSPYKNRTETDIEWSLVRADIAGACGGGYSVSDYGSEVVGVTSGL